MIHCLLLKGLHEKIGYYRRKGRTPWPPLLPVHRTPLCMRNRWTSNMNLNILIVASGNKGVKSSSVAPSGTLVKTEILCWGSLSDLTENIKNRSLFWRSLQSKGTHSRSYFSLICYFIWELKATGQTLQMTQCAMWPVIAWFSARAHKSV